MKKNKQQGFAILEGVLIFVMITMIGGIGFYVYNTKKSADKNYNNADAVSNNAKSVTTKSTEQKIFKPLATTPSPGPTPSRTPQPSSPTSAPSPSPKPTPPPVVTSNINHPTKDNCNRAKFTVYASVASGTNAYGLNGGTEAGKVHYTVKFGEPITDVYCDNDSSGLVFRLDNGATATYSEFYIKDVSLTKP